jgi:hypothetical protein
LQQIYLNKPAEVLPLPQFWGLDHEDPNTFLNECKEKLATTNPALAGQNHSTSGVRRRNGERPHPPTMDELVMGAKRIEEVLANEKGTHDNQKHDTATTAALPILPGAPLPQRLPGAATAAGRIGKRPWGRVRSGFQPRNRRPFTINAARYGNGVYSLIHIILMFFIRSGNHKFYIQFLRLLGLQSFRFRITLYFKKVKISVGTVGLPIARKKNRQKNRRSLSTFQKSRFIYSTQSR